MRRKSISKKVRFDTLKTNSVIYPLRGINQPSVTFDINHIPLQIIYAYIGRPIMLAYSKFSYLADFNSIFIYFGVSCWSMPTTMKMEIFNGQS